MSVLLGNGNLHVLAKDEAGLYVHEIRSANPIHQLDLIHTGGRFAGVGLFIGLLIAGGFEPGKPQPRSMR